MHKLDCMVQSRYVFPEVNLTDLSEIDFPVGIKHYSTTGSVESEFGISLLMDPGQGKC